MGTSPITYFSQAPVQPTLFSRNDLTHVTALELLTFLKILILKLSLLNCVSCVLKTCSRASVPYVLTCLRALRAYVLTCQRVLRAYVLICERAILNNVNSYIIQFC